MTHAAQQIVLASGSIVRGHLLKSAGIQFTQISPGVDETEIKQSMMSEGAGAAEIATTLSELKALRVSQRSPDALVIGADQILECEGVLYDKPGTRIRARVQLTALQGKCHQLISAACVARQGRVIWTSRQDVKMHMRHLDPEVVERYLEAAGSEILECVGSYALEALGAQLFEKVDGDYFAVLGLPLFPLLGFLREHGVGLT